MGCDDCPRRLRPSELCRLLNSKPLGEVINRCLIDANWGSVTTSASRMSTASGRFAMCCSTPTTGSPSCIPAWL
jgi:hypothetical protein